MLDRALQVKPVDDEVLAGYILRVASQRGLTANELIRNMGVRHLSNGRKLLVWRGSSYATAARFLGLSEQDLAAMEVDPPSQPARDGASQPLSVLEAKWGVLPRFSRCCPHCLQADGVWRRAWRFAPIVVCLKHQCMLRGVCDECGRRWFADSTVAGAYQTPPPRVPFPPAITLPASDRCHAVVGSHEFCGADLGSLPTSPASKTLLNKTRRFLGRYPSAGWWSDKLWPTWQRLRAQCGQQWGSRHGGHFQVPDEPSWPYVDDVQAAMRW